MSTLYSCQTRIQNLLLVSEKKTRCILIDLSLVPLQITRNDHLTLLDHHHHIIRLNYIQLWIKRMRYYFENDE